MAGKEISRASLEEFDCSISEELNNCPRCGTAIDAEEAENCNLCDKIHHKQCIPFITDVGIMACQACVDSQIAMCEKEVVLQESLDQSSIPLEAINTPPAIESPTRQPDVGPTISPRKRGYNNISPPGPGGSSLPAVQAQVQETMAQQDIPTEFEPILRKLRKLQTDTPAAFQSEIAQPHVAPITPETKGSIAFAFQRYNTASPRFATQGVIESQFGQPDVRPTTSQTNTEYNQMNMASTRRLQAPQTVYSLGRQMIRSQDDNDGGCESNQMRMASTRRMLAPQTITSLGGQMAQDFNNESNQMRMASTRRMLAPQTITSLGGQMAQDFNNESTQIQSNASTTRVVSLSGGHIAQDDECESNQMDMASTRRVVFSSGGQMPQEQQYCQCDSNQVHMASTRRVLAPQPSASDDDESEIEFDPHQSRTSTPNSIPPWELNPVYEAANQAAYQAANQAAYQAINQAEYQAVNQAVYRAAYEAAYQAAHQVHAGTQQQDIRHNTRGAQIYAQPSTSFRGYESSSGQQYIATTVAQQPEHTPGYNPHGLQLYNFPSSHVSTQACESTSGNESINTRQLIETLLGNNARRYKIYEFRCPGVSTQAFDSTSGNQLRNNMSTRQQEQRTHDPENHRSEKQYENFNASSSASSSAASPLIRPSVSSNYRIPHSAAASKPNNQERSYRNRSPIVISDTESNDLKTANKDPNRTSGNVIIYASESKLIPGQENQSMMDDSKSLSGPLDLTGRGGKFAQNTQQLVPGTTQECHPIFETSLNFKPNVRQVVKICVAPGMPPSVKLEDHSENYNGPPELAIYLTEAPQ